MRFLKSNNIGQKLFKNYQLWLEKSSSQDEAGDMVKITVKVVSADKDSSGNPVPSEVIERASVVYTNPSEPKNYIPIDKKLGWSGYDGKGEPVSASTTDSEGLIKFSLPKSKGKINIIANTTGYLRQTKTLDLSEQSDKVEIIFELVPENKTVSQVEIEARKTAKPPPSKTKEIIKPKEETFVEPPTKFIIIDKNIQVLGLRSSEVQNILTPFIDVMFDGIDKNQISRIFTGQKCLDMFEKMTKGFRSIDAKLITRKKESTQTIDVKFVKQDNGLLKFNIGSAKLKYPPESEIFAEFKGKINLEEKQTLHGLWFLKCFGNIEYNGVPSPQFTSIFANCVDFIESGEGCECFINFNKFVEIVNELGLVKREELDKFAILDRNPIYKYLKDNLDEFETTDKSNDINFEINITDCDNGGELKIKSPSEDSIPGSVYILRKIEDSKIQTKIITRDNQRKISKKLESLFPGKDHSVRKSDDNFEIILNFVTPPRQLLKLIELIKDDY